MYCSNCGAGIPNDSRFCAECGTPVANLSAAAKTPAAADIADVREETISSPEKEQAAAPVEAEEPAAIQAEEQPSAAPVEAEEPAAIHAEEQPSAAPVEAEEPAAVQAEEQPAAAPVEAGEPKSVYESVVMPGTVPRVFGASSENAGQPVFSVPEQTVPVTAASSETSAPPAPKKKGKKGLLIALIALVLVVLGVAAFFVIRNFLPLTSGSRFAYSEMPLMITGEDEIQIYNGASKPVTIDGAYEMSAFSLDGRKMAVSVDPDEDGNSTLYYFDGSKAKELSDGVYSYEISGDGSVVAYLTDFDYESFTGTLNIFDAATGKSKEVAEDVDTSIVLSPDGKSYAYISDIKTDDYGSMEEYTSYISINGKDGEPLDSGLQVVGLSNSANYVYYIEWDITSDTSGKLYVRHGKTDTKIGSADTDESILFNQDFSEVLYSNNDNTYYSKNGGDKKKVADLPVSNLLAPQNTQIGYLYNDLYALHYNVKSLAGQLYIFYDTSDIMFGYLDGKGKLSEIDTISYDTYTFQTKTADDGKGLYILDDSGKIKYIKDATKADAKSEKIEGDDDIISFAVSPDQKTIYFVDVNNTLWVKQGSSDPVDVADDVMDGSLTMAPDGKGVYFISDYSTDNETYIDSGTFCYLSNTKNAKPTEIEEDVASLEVSDFGIVYYVYDKMSDDGYSYVGEAFYSKDGKKFESVMDNAMYW